MKTENLICHRCGKLLEVTDIMESIDCYGCITYLHCSYCGADFECAECSNEEKQKYDFYRGDEPIDNRLSIPDIMNEHCINCGHKVFVSNNFMLSDYDDNISDYDDKMNYVLGTCEYCGMNETRWDVSEHEKLDYEYWKEDVVKDFSYDE